MGPSLLVLPLLLLVTSASAVTMDWTPIGNSGNACEPQIGVFGNPICVGAVNYGYDIGTYEVTNAQYVEFLNAKAKSDPLGLYDTSMLGVINRGGVSGSYTYEAASGWENRPVSSVTWYDAVRFANWMNNGQGGASTETGSYTLVGGTATPSNASSVARTIGATIVLPSENEWYKAAYYDASSSSYFDYPAGSDTPTTCASPTSTPNTANCFRFTPPALRALNVGSYPGSPSPYGTFDQGGNASEWNETAYFGWRGIRGGSSGDQPLVLGAAHSESTPADHAAGYIGFRLAMIPEPSSCLLVIAGLLGFAGWRRARA